MSRVEIDAYLEWLARFAEKCQVTLIALREGKDPNDEEWDLLEAAHKMFYNGELTFYKTIMDEPIETASQKGLFDQ